MLKRNVSYTSVTYNYVSSIRKEERELVFRVIIVVIVVVNCKYVGLPKVFLKWLMTLISGLLDVDENSVLLLFVFVFQCHSL